MPFTLSHAGFLIPLHRRLSPPLLVAAMVGSLVPDFGYFIRRFDLAAIAHSAIGGVLVSLPIGLVLYGVCLWLWQDVASLLPQPHRAFWLTVPRRVDNWIGVAIAILFGAYSHNIADSCTHANGWTVMHIAFLRTPLLTMGGDAIAPYRLLQHGGSILGMAMLLWFYLQALRQFCAAQGLTLWTDRDRWRLWFGLVAGTGLISALLQLPILLENTTVMGLRIFIFRWLITWIPLGFGAIWGLAFVRCVKRT